MSPNSRRCNEDVYIYQVGNLLLPAVDKFLLYFRSSRSKLLTLAKSNNGGCDSGPNGFCSTSAGAAPFHIPAGNGQSSILALGWIQNGFGTSVKISKDAAFDNGILQFEYAFTDNMYWDLSDLDGSGAGLVGTP